MRAHDVRRLRACDVCYALGDKDTMIVGPGNILCDKCALKRAGGVKGFAEMYPVSEWEKLTLGALGVPAMRWLIAKLAEHRNAGATVLSDSAEARRVDGGAEMSRARPADCAPVVRAMEGGQP